MPNLAELNLKLGDHDSDGRVDLSFNGQVLGFAVPEIVVNVSLSSALDLVRALSAKVRELL